VRLTAPPHALADGLVRLRPWTDGDLDCVREAGADPRIPDGTTVPRAFTPDAGLAWLRRQRARAESGEGLSLAVTAEGEDRALGAAVLMLRTQPGVVGIGYWVVPGARGRGLATRAVRLLSSWALGDGGMARVEAWVEPDNAASLRVLAVAGFRQEGVLRSLLSFPDRRADAVVLSRTAADG
jgi:ribosomal-protein-alanine N-acetyltransferase